MKMTTEYMVDLHKFLNSSEAHDASKLIEQVQNHLLFIPRRKLYRYRKSTNLEISTLTKNSIWLSDPDSFLDVIDATISLQGDVAIIADYVFSFSTEAAYIALVRTAEEGEILPSKEEFVKLLREYMKKYNTHTKVEKIAKETFGSDYDELIDIINDNSARDEVVTKLARKAIDLMHQIGQWPRKSVCIASFTTDKDNRNMWENYAAHYSGFCIEYDFRNITPLMNTDKAADILHLLPVRYCSKRPVFDHKKVLEELARQDAKLEVSPINIEGLLEQWYNAITIKLSDYRSEKEWRLVMLKKYQGLYSFPHVSAIYLGKDMPDGKIDKLLKVGKKLGVPVHLQVPSNNSDSFDYVNISKLE